MITRIAKIMLLAVVGLGSSAYAQTGCQGWDSSGNGMLNGQYYIRQVLWENDTTGQFLDDALAIYGVIVFSGSGTYTFSGQLFDPGNAGVPVSYNTTGTYVISASGYSCADSLINSYALQVANGAPETIFGLVSQNIFIGSSTENLSGFAFNDLAIAAPISSPQATNATLKGNYTLIDFDSPVTGSPFETRDSLFTFTADGNGNLTGTTGTGFIAVNGGGTTKQNLSGVKYSFSNGAGNINFPGSLTTSNVDGTLIAGNHYVYISPDGNFIFGGSPTGWDMFVGVRNGTGAPTSFGGLYYQAGMDQDESTLGSGFANLDSYFGSFKTASGTILSHQRVFTAFNNFAFDLTLNDCASSTNCAATFNSDGSSDDATTGQHYIYGLNGALRIGLGVPTSSSSFLGINVALAAPTFSGPGVFLDPTGIVNSGSFALSTAQIAPGEYISLFGSGLANKTDSNSFEPTTLDGVQVLINGVPAPVYVVSANQISVVVPYGTLPGVATVQVINNNVKSAVRTMFVGLSQPGHFTQTQNGIGYVGARHLDANSSLVTPSNPAQPNETISVFLTGLGTVTPTITDGTVTNSRYDATTLPAVYINGIAATVGFAGLAGGAVSLNQMNVTIPSGIPAGDYFLEVAGADSDNFESPISIGSGSVGVNAIPEARVAPIPVRPHLLGLSRGTGPLGKTPPFGSRPIQRD